ncbi:MAG: hypothetical protein WC783_00540 [Candidatus Paceibacterota bacterium]|jgi:hypothetical protein
MKFNPIKSKLILQLGSVPEDNELARQIIARSGWDFVEIEGDLDIPVFLVEGRPHYGISEIKHLISRGVFN